MTARTAYDPSGVQYYFDTNTPGAHDSGWIDTPTYTDVNLVPSTRYMYRVKARDLSARHNETAWSDWVCVTTQTPADTTAPTPNPMQWDPNGLPRELDGGGGPYDFYADMTAVTATDAGGGVQYYFEAVKYPGVSPDGFSSGWINRRPGRVNVGRTECGRGSSASRPATPSATRPAGRPSSLPLCRSALTMPATSTNGTGGVHAAVPRRPSGE